MKIVEIQKGYVVKTDPGCFDFISDLTGKLLQVHQEFSVYHGTGANYHRVNIARKELVLVTSVTPGGVNGDGNVTLYTFGFIRVVNNTSWSREFYTIDISYLFRLVQP